MINFTPIQRDAISLMLAKPVGIVNMPTATGKTVVIFGHILECIKTAGITKHNFIISGPIMDLNKQTASSILTNLWNAGVINSDNIDVVIANCENKKANRSFTWFDNDNKDRLDISDKANGREPVGIPVNTATMKQERQFRLTVVCNPTLQNDEKYLVYVDDENVVNHFYFDESHTLKNSPAEKTDYATAELTEGEAIEKKELERTWVNYTKIFELIGDKGSFHLVSATPTLDNFNVIEEHLHVSDEECFTFCLRPIKAIKSRMIVPPKFKIAKAPKLNLNSIKALTETCIKDIETITSENPNYKAKILITTNSTAELKNMCEWLMDLYGENYNVFSTCCQFGKTLNGIQLNNDIRNFKELIDNSDKPCFVVHIRQIIAGIDIPSFTHAIFNMESSTNFITPIQITGRVLRPAERWPDGSANLEIKSCGYVYINIQDKDIAADKAVRTLTDFYGEIFEYLKPKFFESYTSGSKTRHKITYQFEDTIHLETFEEDTEKFLQQLAHWIHLWKTTSGEILNIENEIKSAIYQKAYTENLPIFYQPELSRYVEKVKEYLRLFATIGI